MGPGGFVCPRAVGCRRARPLCVPVGGGPPASRPRREPLARCVVSKPGQAPPPPTDTAAGPSGALHTGGAVSLECGWVRRLEARPGPAAAHGHRGRSLRRPPHRRRLSLIGGSVRRLEARPGPPPPTGTAARPWTLGGLLVLQSFWGVRLRVVTNVVNPSSFLCGVLSGCYKRRQSDGFFVENGGFGA